MGSLSALLASGALRNAFARGRHWSGLLISLMQQVADGMQYIHAQGIVHDHPACWRCATGCAGR